MKPALHILDAYIDGIGLLGPGLPDWPTSRAILTGDAPYEYRTTILPAPASLPAAERRRCGPIVKLSLAVGFEAAAMAGMPVEHLPTVFSASGGDGKNCHEICEMLASEDRLISPTRFHNSVHNAAAGYWSIAAAATATSSVLCAYDASFGAGLLEALAQVMVDRTPCLLIACDTSYPQPLHAMRPIPDEFGVGLAFSPVSSARSVAKISVRLTSDPADALTNDAFEQQRAGIPSARSLPLLIALASGRATSMVLDYFPNQRLAVEITPCN